MHPIIVIGAGLAGWTTVRELRKLDTTTPVVVITQDSGDFYAKPSLSNAFAQKRGPEQLVSTPAAKMVETLQVTLMARSQVRSIDTAQRTVSVLSSMQSGEAQQQLHYSQLVLATGAQPIRVPVQGDAADAVRSINSLEDFAQVFSALSPRAASANSSEIDSKTIVIMGAGLIGCEFANDLVLAGHRVHVADPAGRPLSALLPAEAGQQLADALAGLGVQWHWGATVQVVEKHGTQLRVSLSNGEAISADAVLSAIGLRADTRLAAAAGLAAERGIVVDTRLQTTAAGVFALGDAVQYASAGQRTLPYVMPIMNAAKVLAANLAGTPTELVFPLMPVSVKTPALPIVVAAASPDTTGAWVAEDSQNPGVWRYLDLGGAQRGFVLTGKHTARRMELSKATVL